MRTALTLSALLFTAPAAWAGSPENDSYSGQFAVAVFISCGLFAVFLVLVSFFVFLMWYSWKRRRGTKIPPADNSKGVPGLPRFPSPGDR
jgi:hypothetical protein